MNSLLRWSNAIALVAAAVVVLVFYDDRWPVAVIIAVLLLATAWYLSPLSGGKTVSWAELSQQPVESRPVVIFWRPGCVFCMRMRASLGRTGRKAAWISIWRDADAAAFVRTANEGNETVPTVLFPGGPETNPHPDTVRRRLERV